MKLQKREKMLLGAAGGLIVLGGLIAFVATGDSRSDDSLRDDRDKLRVELQKKDKEMKAADEDARQLVEWRKRSLPRNAAIAQSLYRDWLVKLCNQAGLGNSAFNIKDDTPEQHHSSTSRQVIYTRIPFRIKARGSLDQLVTFLHGFYSAGNLQLISRLEIKPIQNNTREFDLQFSIDAVAMQDAVSTDKLTKEPGQKLSALTAYQRSIVGRNFFVAYVPPVPAGLGNPPLIPVDKARFAVISGFTQNKDDGKRLVWLRDITTEQTWQLKEGEQFKVGGGSGQVRSIESDDKVILDFNGKRQEFVLGQNLTEGKEL